MIKTKRIIFSPESLLALLTHYTDGIVPLDTVCVSVEKNQFLQRNIGFMCKSSQWEGGSIATDNPNALMPLYLRYEGKKTMSWGDRSTDPTWTDAPEAPKRQ